ncbi:LysR substrate-binding domain-containing protein [Terrilactibacillus sp. S3-3]|nr:LysR substrate-binding domain-containing protein [Terrilactibacillus sp. S3-3]
MNQKLAGSDAGAQRKLVIAASETFCTHYFPYIISIFLGEFPNVNIKLVSCHSNEVIQGIDANLYDIGIISGEYHKSGITNIVISEHEDLVFLHPKIFTATIRLRRLSTVIRLLNMKLPALLKNKCGPI